MHRKGTTTVHLCIYWMNMDLLLVTPPPLPLQCHLHSPSLCGGKFRCKFIIVRVHLKFMNSSTAQYKEMLIQLKLSAPVPPSLQSPLPLDSLASQCHCDCVTLLPVQRDDDEAKLHACLMMWAGTTTLVSPLLDDATT